jgi:hypothetical protein
MELSSTLVWSMENFNLYGCDLLNYEVIDIDYYQNKIS